MSIFKRLESSLKNEVCKIHFLVKNYFFPQVNKSLCTVTFIYDVKGVIGAGKNKTDTVFAWVADASTKHDCVVLFNPPGIGKGQCAIKEIIVLPIPTVTPKPIDE